MLKLIRLEWRKNRISRYVRAALLLAAVLGLFLFALAFWGIANDPDTGVPDTAPGNETIASSIELFTSMSYLVFTGAMLSSFLVRPYQNKTMALMFTYPIKRQKILAAQMLAVWLFCFAALFGTKLLLYGIILLGSRVQTPAFLVDYTMSALPFYLQLLAKSAVTVTMGFIALFVGLALRSGKATLLTSFLLIFLTQANIGDLTLSRNLLLPLLLTALSLLCAVLSVWRVEQKDLM